MELTPKQKSDVQFNGDNLNLTWSSPYTNNVHREFQERYDKIVKLYEELSDEVYWNNIIYNSGLRFQPVIGNIYYLYLDSENKYFISLIKPTEWKMNFVGAFKFEYNGKWIKIEEN